MIRHLSRYRQSRRRFEQAVKDGVVTVGRMTYGIPEVLRWSDGRGKHLGGRVRIGSFVSIADDVRIFTGGNHRTDWTTTFPLHVKYGLNDPPPDQVTSRGDVVIGNDVWLGTGCLIMSGVSVGDGAVVAAGAVVSRDVRPYAVVVGNPSREARRRFDDVTVHGLLALRWWDWTDEQIIASAALLSGPPEALLGASAACVEPAPGDGT